MKAVMSTIPLIRVGRLGGASASAAIRTSISRRSKDGAKAIYLRDFWYPLNDAAPSIKFQVFDFAVNGGLSAAVKVLQSAVKATPDGKWGPISSALLADMDVNDVLLRFNARRLRYYTSLRADLKARFLSGWVNRVADNLDFAAGDN
jgi:lysozyme family protein